MAHVSLSGLCRHCDTVVALVFHFPYAVPCFLYQDNLMDETIPLNYFSMDIAIMVPVMETCLWQVALVSFSRIEVGQDILLQLTRLLAVSMWLKSNV